MYWAIPAGLGGRLRLFLVSATVAYEVDPPELEADPFVADLGPLTFDGPQGPIHSVTVELTAQPPSYLCVLLLEGRAPVELRWP